MEMTFDNLWHLYIDERRTISEIAAIFRVSKHTVAKEFKRFGIPTRSGRESQRIIEIPRDELIQLYEVEQLSLREISTRVSASEEAVRRILIKHNIKRRDKTAGLGGKNKGQVMSVSQKENISKSRKAKFASGEIRHWNTGRTTSIEVRQRISQGLLNGRTPAQSNYGPEWKKQRLSRLELDNHTCQQCGVSKNLHVHHWEPYRFSMDNSVDNLVTFCVDCHHKIHAIYRQEGWTQESEDAFYD